MTSILNFYADESSQSRCKYMVLSGIAIEQQHLDLLRDALREVQVRHQTFGTMKWGKVSQSKLHVYRDYCDVFFRDIAAATAHFHSLTVDTTQLDHRRFNAGDAEVGFNKFIYQLLVKVGRLYGRDHVIHCYLDRRKTRHSLNELQEIVNNGLAKNWGLRSRPVRRIVFRETEDEPVLQLNDVLLGALAARCNGHQLVEGASVAKCDLSEHILRSASIRDPLLDTPRSTQRFTTWMFALRGVRRP